MACSAICHLIVKTLAEQTISKIASSRKLVTPFAERVALVLRYHDDSR